MKKRSKISVACTLNNPLVDHMAGIDKLALKEFIKENQGKKAVIDISLHKSQRTLAQNAFFHGVVIPAFCRCMGHDVNDSSDFEYVKYSLKEQFLRVIRPDGTYYVRGSSELSVEESREFIQSCIDYLFTLPDGYLSAQEILDYQKLFDRKPKKG